MAAETQASPRIDILARSKPIPDGFCEDRRSVYWIDRWPFTPNASGTTDFSVTPRLNVLAKSKNVHSRYKGDRPTPMWPVSSGAMNASCSDRLQNLAREKTVAQYRYHRSVYTEIPLSALNAHCSVRLDMLSSPKPHKVWLTSNDTRQEGHFSLPITPVPPTAMRSVCTPRVEALAEAKSTNPAFKAERYVQWPVSENAMNAQATQRLQQLARPKSGRMKSDDYDPYKVSIGARLTRATPRVTELCLPLPRKQRQKKAV